MCGKCERKHEVAAEKKKKKKKIDDFIL